MKKLPVILSVLFIVLLAFSGCQKQAPVAPNLNQESVEVSLEKAEIAALEMIELSNWEIDTEAKLSDGSMTSLEKCRPHPPRPRPRPPRPGPCPPNPYPLRMIDRQHVAGDIYYYTFEMSVGSHPHNKIGIHRVVKEKCPCRPIRTDKNIFLQHGDCKNFETMFLPGMHSPNMPNGFGLAVYLAENDVDVWGISQAWTFVPTEASDFSFMEGWGLQKQVNDLRTAMEVAYVVRMLTGCGDNKFNLLGYSSGVWTGYALLNEESQISSHRRMVSGFIPADGTFKTDNEGLKQTLLGEYNRLKDMIDQGQYADWVPFATVGNLARNNPDGDSPLFPGFTNIQAAMFYAAGPIFGSITFHYFAGIWENDFPVDLQYVTKDQFFDFMEASVTWEAAQFMNDYAAITCEVVDLPFDDHLGDIEVPIFNVAPAGGFGELSKYTTTFLGSADITHLIPSLNPPGEILIDFAHIDMFLAHNAPSLVWQPILNWIQTH